MGLACYGAVYYVLVNKYMCRVRLMNMCNNMLGEQAYELLRRCAETNLEGYST